MINNRTIQPIAFIPINPHIHKSRFAVAQFNSGEGPIYNSPIFLKLIDDPRGSYLRAAPLSIFEKIEKRLHLSTTMRSVAQHLYIYQNSIFPDPLNHNYLQEKLGRKLISYRNKHLGKDDPYLEIFDNLCSYLQSFEERLATAVAERDTGVLRKLLEIGTKSPHDSKKINSIRKHMGESPEIFAENFTASQLKAVLPLPPMLYEAFLTALCRVCEENALDSIHLSNIVKQLYLLAANRPPEIQEKTVVNLLDSFPLAKLRAIVEASLETATSESLSRLQSLGIHFRDHSKTELYTDFFTISMVSWLPENLTRVASLLTLICALGGQHIVSDFPAGLVKKLVNSKDAEESGFFHHLFHNNIDNYASTIPFFVKYFEEKQRESLFASNKKGVAPLHIVMAHFLSNIRKGIAPLEADRERLNTLIRRIPLVRLIENLSSNQHTCGTCLSDYLSQLITKNQAEKLRRGDVGLELPNIALPYIFTFNMFRKLIELDPKLAFDTSRIVSRFANNNDAPVIASAYLAAAGNIPDTYYENDFALWDNAYLLASKDRAYLKEHLGNPQFFQAFLEYPSLAYFIYREMPEAFVAKTERLAWFQTLPATVQEKNCWLLPNEEIRSFIENINTLDIEAILRTPLPEHAHTPTDFLTAIRKATTLQQDKGKKEQLRLLADQFSPVCFIALTQDPAYIPELCAIFPHLPPYIAKVVNLYLRSESLAPLLAEKSIPFEVRWNYAVQSIEKLKQELKNLQALASEPPISCKSFKEKITIALKLAIIKDTQQMHYDFLMIALHYRIAYENRLTEGLQHCTQDPGSPNSTVQKQFNECEKNYESNASVIHGPLLNNEAYSAKNFYYSKYEPDKSFFDSTLFGSIMRIPLIPPLKDQNGDPLPTKARFDASLFDRSEFAINVEGKGIFYRNPFDNQLYRREEFKVDEPLRDKIATWKNNNPYWKKYIELTSSN